MENQILKFDKLVYGGDCLGRLPDGRAVFVPFVLPHETTEIVITESKERFARGEVVRLLEQSPQRIQAPCPYFGVCGGCHYQHLDYAQELKLKKNWLSISCSESANFLIYLQSKSHPHRCHPVTVTRRSSIQFPMMLKAWALGSKKLLQAKSFPSPGVY